MRKLCMNHKCHPRPFDTRAINNLQKEGQTRQMGMEMSAKTTDRILRRQFAIQSCVAVASRASQVPHNQYQSCQVVLSRRHGEWHDFTAISR